MCHAKCQDKQSAWWLSEGKEHHSIKLRTGFDVKGAYIPMLEVPPEFLAACRKDRRAKDAVDGFLLLLRLIGQDCFERRALVSP